MTRPNIPAFSSTLLRTQPDRGDNSYFDLTAIVIFCPPLTRRRLMTELRSRR